MNIFNDDSNFVYLLNAMGQQIKINGKEERALISNRKEMIVDYKKIKTIIPFNTGDIIEYQGSSWIVIGEVSKTNTIYKSTIQKANHIIKMYINNKLQEFPSIIETSTQTINTGNAISVVEGNIKVKIQDNSITNKIDYNDEFIKMNCKWQVNGFTSEILGLKYLYCSKTQFSDIDDKENEIANRWKYETKHNYIFSVEPKQYSFNETETKQIIVSITDNNVNVVNPSIAYISNNPDIATVDSVGLINGVTEGNCNITVSFVGQDLKTYIEIINIEVKKVPVIPPTDIITYDLTSSTGVWIIKKTNTVTFIGHKYINGNQVPANFEFELDRNSLTTAQITIPETTATYIKIKNVGIDTTTPPKTIFLKYREVGNIDWLQKEVSLTGIYG